VLWIEVEALYSSIGILNDLLELRDKLILDPLGIKHIYLAENILDFDVVIDKH
jgi:hypothetical protein